MRDYTDRFIAKYGRFVEPGDCVRAALRASAAGTAAGTVSRLAIGGGAVGAAVGSRLAQGKARRSADAQPASLAARFPRKKSLVLVLTLRWFMIMEQGELTNRPRRVLQSYPAQQLVAAGVTKGRLANQLLLHFADESDVVLEIERHQRPDRFTAAVEAGGYSSGPGVQPKDS